MPSGRPCKPGARKRARSESASPRRWRPPRGLPCSGIGSTEDGADIFLTRLINVTRWRGSGPRGRSANCDRINWVVARRKPNRLPGPSLKRSQLRCNSFRLHMRTLLYSRVGLSGARRRCGPSSLCARWRWCARTMAFWADVDKILHQVRRPSSSMPTPPEAHSATARQCGPAGNCNGGFSAYGTSGIAPYVASACNQHGSFSRFGEQWLDARHTVSHMVAERTAWRHSAATSVYVEFASVLECIPPCRVFGGPTHISGNFVTYLLKAQDIPRPVCMEAHAINTAISFSDRVNTKEANCPIAAPRGAP